MITYKGPSHQQPLDYNGFPRGAHVVSDAFRAILEHVEPGRHQFFPVTVMRKDNVIGRMSILIVGAQIDAGNHQLCRPAREGRRIYSLNHGPNWRCVLDPAEIARHHLWHDKHRLGLFMSETLATALEEAQLEGYKLGTPIEVAAC